MPGEVNGKSFSNVTPPSLKEELDIMKEANFADFRLLSSTTFFSLKAIESSEFKDGLILLHISLKN